MENMDDDIKVLWVQKTYLFGWCIISYNNIFNGWVEGDFICNKSNTAVYNSLTII